jgi:hypothetical protein
MAAYGKDSTLKGNFKIYVRSTVFNHIPKDLTVIFLMPACCRGSGPIFKWGLVVFNHFFIFDLGNPGGFIRNLSVP